MTTTIIFIQLKTSAETQDLELSENSRPQRKLWTARSEMHKKQRYRNIELAHDKKCV